MTDSKELSSATGATPPSEHSGTAGAQSPGYLRPDYYVYENTEVVDLLQILKTLWEYKLFCFSFSLLAFAICWTVTYHPWMESQYRSWALFESPKYYINKRDLAERAITKLDLLPYLYRDAYDPMKGVYHLSSLPTPHNASLLMEGQISQENAESGVKIGVQALTPEMASLLVSFYMQEIMTYATQVQTKDLASKREAYQKEQERKRT